MDVGVVVVAEAGSEEILVEPTSYFSLPCAPSYVMAVLYSC